MQEEIAQRCLSLIIDLGKWGVGTGARLTGATLRAAISKLLRVEGGHGTPPRRVGKQTVKQLVRQNQGVSNIELNDPDIKKFERICRKYGVDYAVKKQRDTSKYLVFFKARDADALTAAFAEFTKKKVRSAQRPSVLAQLEKFKALVASMAPIAKARKKVIER